jgi:cyclophilin family peptidyl-prolyl cis-trans isomerase
MTLSKPLKFLKIFTLCALAFLVSACGGSNDFVPVVTGAKVQSAQYGKTATIYLGGKDLRSNLSVDTSGACTEPTFASNSNTDTLVLNCVVTKTGDFSLVVQTAEGAAIYSTTLNIPLPQVALITAKGSITVELDPTLAPISTNNFLSYVNKGFYRSTLFHRVIPNFVVQGGGYTTGMVKKTEQSAPIELESNKGLSNLRGSLAMARTNLPNSATSEFYINLVDNLSLDYKNSANPGYAVFGKVIQGMDVVDAMAAEPTGVVGGFSDVPLADIALSLALQTK